jgi:ProP effector
MSETTENDPAEAPAPSPVAEAPPASPTSEAPRTEPPPDTGPAPGAEPSAVAGAGLSPAETAERLKSLFPALFTGPSKPIKLRIQADIQARAPGQFTKAVLSAFLRRYTGSTSYLIALTRAAQRLDLDGQPAGEISDEHRHAAAEELARRRSVHEARREAEEAGRRERAQLLRAFETTTLTRENFCALKGVSPEALEAQLAQAREEARLWREQQAQRPQGGAGHPGGRPGGRPERRQEGRPGPRGEGERSGPRQDAQGRREDRPDRRGPSGPGGRPPRPPRPAR